jgi:DNA sulfur modification protein DndB
MEFFFPAVRGVQGGKTYFVASVPFRMLKRIMSFDNGDVLDRSQRAVDPTRARSLSQYLVENPSTFVLPALTGIVEDQELRFDEIGGEGSNVGRLTLSLDATIKLFDGQHRATGIMNALRDCPALQHNNITIQLFKDMTLAERQQAFSDINANAKPVSASLNMTYNQRNEVITALAAEVAKVEAWQGKIDHERNVIGKGSNALFSFRHVISASRLVIGLSSKTRLTSIEASLIGDVSRWWNEIASSVGWTLEERPEDSVAYTAAGLMALARVPAIMRERRGNKWTMWKAAKALKNIDWKKSNELWSGNLVDSKGNMTSTTAAQIAAANVIADHVCTYSDFM